MTLQNEKFEELISAQLTATLEPQRGKALAAFRAHIASEAQAGSREAEKAAVAGGSKSKQSWANREVSGRAMWIWTGLPAVAAACLAVVVTMKVLTPAGGGGIGNSTNNLVAKGWGSSNTGNGGTLASQVELTSNADGAPVIQDNVPMRAVTQQTVRQTQWFDPNEHATYTITEPVEKVDYIQVKPN